MTFAFYKNGKKYTINNAVIFDCCEDLPNTLLITSTRGYTKEDEIDQNQELLGEIQEGIDWNHVEIN